LPALLFRQFCFEFRHGPPAFTNLVEKFAVRLRTHAAAVRQVSRRCGEFYRVGAVTFACLSMAAFAMIAVNHSGGVESLRGRVNGIFASFGFFRNIPLASMRHAQHDR
jgi:hypothetical protein